MSKGEIIGICVIGAFVIYGVVLSIISRKKAKKIGILRVKFVRSVLSTVAAVFIGFDICFCVFCVVKVQKYNDYIADMETRGITAVAEHKNKAVSDLLYGVTDIDEESYVVNREISTVRGYVKDLRGNVFSMGMSAVGLFSLVWGAGVYVTKDGLMGFYETKPQKATAKVKEKKICFYTENATDTALVKFSASEANKKLFAGFIVPEKTGQTQPSRACGE